MNKKMADIDIDPFGEHESRPEEPTDENIPLTPGGLKEDQLGNWNVNRKHHLEALKGPRFAEVQVVQVYFTKNT